MADSMEHLTTEQVQHVARLSRLEFSKDELGRFARHLNAILEYMALSKPVVATDLGSIPEQVIDGKTGYLISPGDHDALAERIISLLNNPELADNMGAAGREFAEMNFSVKRMVNQYEALFTDLIN